MTNHPVPYTVYDYDRQCYVSILDAHNASKEHGGEDFHAKVLPCGHREKNPACYGCTCAKEIVKVRNPWPAEQRKEANEAFGAFQRAFPGVDTGHYMFMGKATHGRLSFKDRDTRLYVYISEAWLDPERCHIPSQTTAQGFATGGPNDGGEG